MKQKTHYFDVKTISFFIPTINRGLQPQLTAITRAQPLLWPPPIVTRQLVLTKLTQTTDYDSSSRNSHIHCSSQPSYNNQHITTNSHNQCDSFAPKVVLLHLIQEAANLCFSLFGFWLIQGTITLELSNCNNYNNIC